MMKVTWQLKAATMASHAGAPAAGRGSVPEGSTTLTAARKRMQHKLDSGFLAPPRHRPCESRNAARNDRAMESINAAMRGVE